MVNDNQCNAQMSDEELMSDVLEAQKHVTGLYNSVANESASQQIRSEFLSILGEEHQIQANVFDEMSKRGWYQTEAAEQQKINQAKQKFNTMG